MNKILGATALILMLICLTACTPNEIETVPEGIPTAETSTNEPNQPKPSEGVSEPIKKVQSDMPMEGTDYLILKHIPTETNTYRLPVFKHDDYMYVGEGEVWSGVHNITLDVSVKALEASYDLSKLVKLADTRMFNLITALESDVEFYDIVPYKTITVEDTLLCGLTTKRKNSFIDGSTSDILIILKFELTDNGTAVVDYELRYEPNYYETIDDRGVFDEICGALKIDIDKLTTQQEED